MEQPPVRLARHRIHVAAAQEADVIGVFQLIHSGREPVEFMHEKRNRANVFVAPVLQQFFPVALGFEGDAGHLHIQSDRYDGGHGEDEQQHVARFGITFDGGFGILPHELGRS